jgi:hypothetical protein
MIIFIKIISINFIKGFAEAMSFYKLNKSLGYHNNASSSLQQDWKFIARDIFKAIFKNKKI